MVCRWEDGEWGGEISEIGHGKEGEEWGPVEFGSVELVIWGREGTTSTYGSDGLPLLYYGKRGGCFPEAFQN